MMSTKLSVVASRDGRHRALDDKFCFDSPTYISRDDQELVFEVVGIKAIDDVGRLSANA